MPSLDHLCRQTIAIVETTADFILGEVGKVNALQAEEKTLNSLVSYVDRGAEERLVEGLRRLLPQAGFLTEEATVIQREADERWIIDPLDGTTNFLFQLPHYAVSVGLERNGEIVLGVVYEVNRKECFYAWRGGGAYLNGRRIRCNDNSRLADALLATGFHYHDHSQLPQLLATLDQLIRQTRGVRRWGAAALDLAFTACGRFDGFFELNLNAWDVAGGAVILTEAGGRLSDFSGGDNYLFGGETLAASNALFPALLEVMRENFGPGSAPSV